MHTGPAVILALRAGEKGTAADRLSGFSVTSATDVLKVSPSRQANVRSRNGRNRGK